MANALSYVESAGEAASRLRTQIDATCPGGCTCDRCRDIYAVLVEREELLARVAELEAHPWILRTSREADDRAVDRVLATLLLREGGRVEFTAAEMQEAPAHGEFVVLENLLTHGLTLTFTPSEFDMSKTPPCECGGRPCHCPIHDAFDDGHCPVCFPNGQA